MKRLKNLRPLVKSLFLLSLHYTFVTRRWKDLSMFHYWIQQFPTWSPLDHQDWGKFKIFLRFVCKFCLRWDEENWINMDRNVSLIILIIVTRRKRYLSPACCLWYWQRKKFIRSEKRLYDETSGCKKLNKRDAFAFKNVRYISPYLRLIYFGISKAVATITVFLITAHREEEQVFLLILSTIFPEDL